MTCNRLLLTPVLVFSFFLSGSASDAIPAFPGAEGFGSESAGGRGGAVYLVTNLNDSGPGSLRAAVEASGPRTVVFRISGTIRLNSPLSVRNSRLTIAGQTAPGDGICIRDYPFLVSADDVVVRFIRFRLGDESRQDADCVWVQKGRRIIFDHCSASWGIDETFSVATDADRLDDVTVQWSFITESLRDSIHPKGSHGYGSLIRGNRGSEYSFHHNLYAHHSGRSPRPGVYDDWDHERDPDGLLLDFRNNVIYNFAGGHAGYNGDHESITKINYVGNYLKRGNNSRSDSVAYKEESTYNKGYFLNNAMDGVIPPDPYDLVRWPDTYTPAIIAGYKQAVPFNSAGVLTDDPVVGLNRVLDFGGAIFPKRDAVDARVVDHVRNGTGVIINTQVSAGGWPNLASAATPVDTDLDGMPDDWENERGLNPNSAADGNLDRNNDGYTNLEDYLNWLVRPTVRILSGPATVAEGDLSEVLFERTGYTNSSLRVDLDVAGDSDNGSDWRTFFPAVFFGAGKQQAALNLASYYDDVVEPTETLSISIRGGTDAFRLDDQSQVELQLIDQSGAFQAVSGWTAR